MAKKKQKGFAASADLNPEQMEAVCHTDGHLLVFAGAGSGKTRVLTTRIAFLIEEGVPPHEILAVTFTNKAADEMKERMNKLLSANAGGIWLGTFHSICARILRRDIELLEGESYKNDFVIYDGDEQDKVLKECLGGFSAEITPWYMKNLIQRFKRINIFPPSTASFSSRERHKEEKIEVMRAYDKTLKKANALDFADLLMLTERLFKQSSESLDEYREQFSHILIDEYQDTNKPQFEIIRSIGQDNAHVFAVGDDSQSIYGWRGAYLENILKFSEHFPKAKIVHLNKNYRSTGNIINAANEVIKNNKGEKKMMEAVGEQGCPVEIQEVQSEGHEADFVADKIKSLSDENHFSWGEFAILYRTNGQSRLLEDSLKKNQIHYVVVKALSFYEHEEIRDIIAYLRLLSHPSNDVAVRRIINNPLGKIERATVEKLSGYAREKDVSIMKAARSAVKANSLTPEEKKPVVEFISKIDALANEVEGVSAETAINLVLEKTGYGELIEKEADKKENIDELINIAREYEHEAEDGDDHVRGFLEKISLASDQDIKTEGESVKLMTLHAAKGLEFPVVFIVGVVDGVIPHFRSIEANRKDSIEEERRLFYVGMTRAKERLFLVYSSKKTLQYGKSEGIRQYPSPFLKEIPEDSIRWNGKVEVDKAPTSVSEKR
ncbi:MAG: ATP-dependent helicase [Thermodesulfobacteriota bacterium]